jgi:hypothetical protein
MPVYSIDDESIAELLERGLSARAFVTLMRSPRAYGVVPEPRFLVNAGGDDLERWSMTADGDIRGRPRPVPSVADLAILAQYGTAFLFVANGSVLDIQAWGESIRRMRVLTLSGFRNWGSFANEGRLRDLDAVEWLWIESGLTAPVDLSELPALREAHVSDPMAISLLANPGVARLRVMFDAWPRGIEVTQSLTELRIETRSATARPPRIHHPETLVSLTLGRFRSIDLASLAEATRLESLVLDCRRVTGITLLAGLPRLRSLTLTGVTEIDERDLVLELPLTELRIDRNLLFDTDFIARAAAVPGLTAHIERPPGSDPRGPTSPLEVIDPPDADPPLRTVAFTDWEWLAATHVRLLDTGLRVNGYVVEEAARLALSADAPDIHEGVDFDFDSESAGMYLCAATAEVLARLVAVLVPIFNDPRRFGRLLRKAAARVDDAG